MLHIKNALEALSKYCETRTNFCAFFVYNKKTTCNYFFFTGIVIVIISLFLDIYIYVLKRPCPGLKQLHHLLNDSQIRL